MSTQDDKQPELSQRFRQMMQVTHEDDKENHQRIMASRVIQMMDTTRRIEGDEHQKELAQNLVVMMQKTRSFDSERQRLEKAGETALSDAFARMMQKTQELEEKNKISFEIPTDVGIEHFPSAGDKLFHLLISKLPKRIQRFPAAFRRNPRAVMKYFLAMALGRILAITLYVAAAFIPALPVPESVAGVVGRAPTFFGSALTAMRGAVVEFSPQAIMAIVTNIPTDINKLIQKVGEFFQYHGQRAGKFCVKAVKNPKGAAEDFWHFVHHQQQLLKLCKGALGIAFSFFLIKLAMIFLLPFFGGIAITFLGFKVSILLVIVVRMAISTLSDVIGKILGKRIVAFCKDIYAHPEKISETSRKLMDDWMNEWAKNNSSRWIKTDENDKK